MAFKRYFGLPNSYDIRLQLKELWDYQKLFFNLFTPFFVAQKILTKVDHQIILTWLIQKNIPEIELKETYMTQNAELSIRGAILILYHLGFLNNKDRSI